MTGLLFLGTVTSIGSTVEVLILNSCIDSTFDAMEEMLDLGFDTEQAGCIGNLHYADCMGYEVIESDYRGCI